MSKADTIAELLKKEYPDPKTELNHENEMQLAVAIALSAQTTDKKVNEVTKRLFKKYMSWKDFASADLEDLRKDIYGVNFHKGKAERIINMARMILDNYNSEMPHSIGGLIKLPGFARKSANVMLNEAWGKSEGIVVDTHVKRVSNRLGLTKNSDPVKIEKELMEQIKRKYWRNISGALVLHGRYVCTARNPKCGECVLNKVCPSAYKA